MNYTIPIQTAFFLFPLIAVFMTLPYVLFHYHKYGSISFFRTLIVYSFVLYFINIYFLVILPLPKVEDVVLLTTPYVQWIPFHFLVDIVQNVNIMTSDFSSILAILKSQEFLQVLYNFVMMIPLGIYLRYYFKCNFRKTLLISFLVSLFFELTQLSGLYFFYPRPYRLFDVDDMIFNTLGGVMGFFLTSIVLRLLPSREEIDRKAYQKGRDVTFLRRVTAFVIDWLMIFILVMIVSLALSIFHFDDSFIWVIPFVYFIVYGYSQKGQTVGQKFVNLKLVSQNNKPPKFLQYVVRYGFLYGTLFTPFIVLFLLLLVRYNYWPLFIAIGVIFLMLCIICFIFVIELITGLFQKNKCYFYDRISKTKIVSTILMPSKNDTK